MQLTVDKEIAAVSTAAAIRRLLVTLDRTA